MAVSFDFRKRLGAGYFGEVWYAIDLGLNYEVAVKRIPKDRLINQKNFYQEAQTLKAAEHPNIVRVFDTGTLSDGQVYISMEYLPSGSLEDESSGAPLPLSRSQRVMIDLLRGLQYAHTQNIVHRDIKPANIMIGNNGEGKLSDFGLALPDISTLNMSYMKEYQYFLHLAPEVGKVSDYTNLSDIYACGATLYRMVNGDSMLPKLPINMLHDLAQQGKFPPRNQYRDYIPASLKRLINKALNVNPWERFGSPDEMRHALEQQAFYIDWNESTTGNSVIWQGTDGYGVHHQISKYLESTGVWGIETRIGHQFPLRRVSKYCFSGLPKAQADQQAKNLLQSYVTGKA